MVEVFKTNVNEHYLANILLDKIHEHFNECEANFDLEDCDKILRIESNKDPVPAALVINLLEDMGFYAEILPDTIH